VATSEVHPGLTLVFDEIDSGIGGTVAQTVGQMMQRLGERHQVLAVTHLAQVAAAADHHFTVTKVQHVHGVSSLVQQLSAQERVGEIARMLGGRAESSVSLAHAQELLTP
jgi:DNA repair protein RecN (Recombination protein N)